MKNRFNNLVPIRDYVMFDSYGVLIPEYWAAEELKQMELKIESILAQAGEVIGRPMSIEEEEPEYIDILFSSDVILAKAYARPGFPFMELNGIYRSYVGKNHPIFDELFGESFNAGTFLGGPEIEGGVTNTSQEAIIYLYFGDGEA